MAPVIVPPRWVGLWDLTEIYLCCHFLRPTHGDTEYPLGGNFGPRSEGTGERFSEDPSPRDFVRTAHPGRTIVWKDHE